MGKAKEFKGIILEKISRDQNICNRSCLYNFYQTSDYGYCKLFDEKIVSAKENGYYTTCYLCNKYFGE